MTDLAERLRQGLRERYDVIRELGRGGMATVYLALDIRHDRNVAIKVLRPELAYAIGTDRFLREINVAANLTHPNILPLHDSGEVDGLLYYVMPYIEGESLRERISRDGPLPIDDAVRLTRRIAGALHHAHSHGVVHRDIKPGNVLLTGDQVVLSDFGIARAVDSIHAEKLTGTGMVLGTPSYMSPEQVAGDQDLDGRSDIYSLACMLYEMLVGEPPFSAGNAHAVMARQAVDRVPSVRKSRAVPRSLELAIDKALAKAPADRFQDAAEFASALEVGPGLSGMLGRIGWEQPRRKIAMALGLVVLIAGSVFLGARMMAGGPRGVAESDEVAMAVMPFRVGGGIAPEHGDLATGLPQLLYERFPGDAGPRAVFPTAVASALRRAGREEAEALSPDDAAEVARDVGADQVLLGQVVGAGETITLTATLYDATTGEEIARADDVTGPVDSLLSLVDELSAKLLSRQAGVPEQRLPTLLSTRLPALRAYLAGQADQTVRQYAAAAAAFNEALDHDSTFALAALSLLLVRDHAPGASWARALRSAWTYRDRLSPRDQLMLSAVIGPRYPVQATAAERLNAWEAVTYESPDRPEAWYELGSLRFRVGALVGMQNAFADAETALKRAIEIDPEHAQALDDLLELAILKGDTAGARVYGDRIFGLETGGGSADYHHWRLAAARADTATLNGIRARFDELPTRVHELIVGKAQLDGVQIEDARRAAETLRRSAVRRDERDRANVTLRELLLNLGRPREASTVPWRETTPVALGWSRLHQVVFALYWGADSSAPERARSDVLDTLTTVDPDPMAPVHFEVCASGLWRIASGDHAAAERAIAYLKSVPGSLDDLSSAYIEVCADMLDAKLAWELGDLDALQRLEHLDSLMRTGVEVYGMMTAAANITVARLFEARGDIDRALAAIRRRRYSSRGVPLLSTMLREEGRLAELTGDVDGALAAYSHYLTLRYDPEPEEAPVVEEVQGAVSRLVERVGSVALEDPGF
ncbi:MAG: protein kinase [Gemmatimonadota bacterium]